MSHLSEKLKILQHRLAEIDLHTEPRHSPPGFTEFLLLKLKDIKIKMYQERGHATPHIHIDYGKKNHAASFSVHNPSRINGALPSKYDKSITGWIIENNKMLIDIWGEAQAGGNPAYLIAQLSGCE